jgi:hypothetical protein
MQSHETPTFLEVHQSPGHCENCILPAAFEKVHFAHFFFTVADVNRRVFTMYSVLMQRVTRMSLATKREHHCGKDLIVIFGIDSLKGRTVNIVYRVCRESLKFGLVAWLHAVKFFLLGALQ